MEADNPIIFRAHVPFCLMRCAGDVIHAHLKKNPRVLHPLNSLSCNAQTRDGNFWVASAGNRTARSLMTRTKLTQIPDTNVSIVSVQYTMYLLQAKPKRDEGGPGGQRVVSMIWVAWH